MAQSVKFVQKLNQILHRTKELCYLCNRYGSSKD